MLLLWAPRHCSELEGKSQPWYGCHSIVSHQNCPWEFGLPEWMEAIQKGMRISAMQALPGEKGPSHQQGRLGVVGAQACGPSGFQCWTLVSARKKASDMVATCSEQRLKISLELWSYRPHRPKPGGCMRFLLNQLTSSHRHIVITQQI